MFAHARVQIPAGRVPAAKFRNTALLKAVPSLSRERETFLKKSVRARQRKHTEPVHKVLPLSVSRVCGRRPLWTRGRGRRPRANGRRRRVAQCLATLGYRENLVRIPSSHRAPRDAGMRHAPQRRDLARDRAWDEVWSLPVSFESDVCVCAYPYVLGSRALVAVRAHLLARDALDRVLGPLRATRRARLCAWKGRHNAVEGSNSFFITREVALAERGYRGFATTGRSSGTIDGSNAIKSHRST